MCCLTDAVITLRTIAVKIGQDRPCFVRRVLSGNVNLESMDDAIEYDVAIEEPGIGLARLTSWDGSDHGENDGDKPEHPHDRRF